MSNWSAISCTEGIGTANGLLVLQHLQFVRVEWTKNVQIAYRLEVLDTKAHYFGAIASLGQFTPRKHS